jgi:putative colanic acid biosynthesis glycosyltransferase
MNYSIITVTWNNLEGLINTWKSICNQDFNDYEWVVIDGGSTDGTREWLIANAPEQCIWISEPDKGIFDAMNKGIERSKADYMVFMNAGDEFFEPSSLSKIAKEIGRCILKPLLVYGDAIDFVTNEKSYHKKAKSYKALPLTMFTSHQAMFFNRKFGEEHQIRYPLQYKITGDYAYIALYFKQITDNNRVLYLPFPFCRFMLGGTNETHRFEALKEDFHIRREIMGMRWIKAEMLYILHFLHTKMKRLVPGFTKLLRYGK